MKTFKLVAAAKELIAFLIRFSGLPWIMREWVFRNKISIIVYHDPTPEALECHLEYLQKHYHFISLTDALNAISTNSVNKMLSKSLVITIDDGHVGNYGLLKLFKRYQVKPTIYLNSHIVGTHRHFWSKKVKEPSSFYKKFSLNQFLSCLEKEYDFTPEREYSTRQALSHQEISEMAPWVDFQCHGRYHFNLIICDNDTATAEIVDSKIEFKKILGQDCDHFAYPFGDYTNRDVTIVKGSGYKSGRTTDPGVNDAHSDPYRLKTIAMIPDHASINMLCAQLSGLPSYVDCLLTNSIKRFKQLTRNSHEKFIREKK